MLTDAITWNSLEIIMLSEMSDTNRQISYNSIYIIHKVIERGSTERVTRAGRRRTKNQSFCWDEEKFLERLAVMVAQHCEYQMPLNQTLKNAKIFILCIFDYNFKRSWWLICVALMTLPLDSTSGSSAEDSQHALLFSVFECSIFGVRRCQDWSPSSGPDWLKNAINLRTFNYLTFPICKMWIIKCAIQGCFKSKRKYVYSMFLLKHK